MAEVFCSLTILLLAVSGKCTAFAARSLQFLMGEEGLGNVTEERLNVQRMTKLTLPLPK